MSSTTVNFNLKDAGFANFANQTLTFKLLKAGADKTDDTVILPTTVTATSAADGTGSVSLFRNGESDIDSVFEVILPNREKAEFIIPSSSSSINLSDLLVDHAPSGAASQQSSVFDSAIQRSNHTGTQTLSTISDSSTIQLKPSEGAFANGDKTKLDGIEASATADQTNAEIRAAVEAASDSNVFTDADHSKLDGIEASADVTDTTNVTSAGALMDSEVTNLSLVKGLTGGISNGNVLLADGTVSDNDFLKINGTSVEGRSASEVRGDLNVEDGATADQTASEIRTLVESATDSNVFTDADHTKLNSIAGSTTEEIQDIAGALVATGGTKTGITVTYDDANNNMDFVVASQTDENFTTADHAKLDSLDTTAISNFVPRSIVFDDSSAFLSIADDATIDVGTGDFSLAFWARLDSSATEGVLQKNGSAGYAVKFNSGNLILTLNDSGGSSDFTLASSLNDNKWHVYVITVDRNGNAIAYVDNVAQTGVSVSGKSGNLDNTSAFQIGIVGSDGNAGVSLGNYVALFKSLLSASNASKIYFSRDNVKVIGAALAVDLRRETETFKDVSASPLTVTSNGSVTFNEARLTEFTGTNVLATSTLGYTTGSGGTVSQTSNKGTGVTLNKATGQITLDDASLAANTGVTFTLTNSAIAANDILVFNHVSGGTIGAYNFNAVASSGSAVVTIRNITSGALTDAIVLSFAVIKAVTS